MKARSSPPREAKTARYAGLSPASPRASKAARGASRKRDTRAEMILRRELWARGLRYRVCRTDLPGSPDITVTSAAVAIFCDGDFWHGRDLDARLGRLRRGHNASYWTKKIQGNVDRDRRVNARLVELGWTVLRFWESDIARDVDSVVDHVCEVVARKLAER